MGFDVGPSLDFRVLGPCWATSLSDYRSLLGLGLLVFGTILGFECHLGIGPLFSFYAIKFGPIEGSIKWYFTLGVMIS